MRNHFVGFSLSATLHLLFFWWFFSSTPKLPSTPQAPKKERLSLQNFRFLQPHLPTHTLQNPNPPQEPMQPPNLATQAQTPTQTPPPKPQKKIHSKTQKPQSNQTKKPPSSLAKKAPPPKPVPKPPMPPAPPSLPAPPPSIYHYQPNKSQNQDIAKLYGEEFLLLGQEEKEFIQKSLNSIGQITQRYLKYPDLAGRLGQDGVNVVEFYLHPNGDISQLRLLTQTGYKLLDKNTLHTIELAYKDYPYPTVKTKIRIQVTYLIY